MIRSVIAPRGYSYGFQCFEIYAFWGVTQRRVVIIYRCFGTTYRSHFQGSRSSRRVESRQEKHAFYVGRGAGGDS
jgi:hypothetical protein